MKHSAEVFRFGDALSYDYSQALHHRMMRLTIFIPQPQRCHGGRMLH